jgi:hypothetical protein
LKYFSSRLVDNPQLHDIVLKTAGYLPPAAVLKMGREILYMKSTPVSLIHLVRLSARLHPSANYQYACT